MRDRIRTVRFSAFSWSFLVLLVCTNRVPGITLSAIRKKRVQALKMSMKTAFAETLYCPIREWSFITGTGGREMGG